jgi:hypothetical protein
MKKLINNQKNQSKLPAAKDSYLKVRLREELEKSILLDEADREYWLNAIRKLPEESVPAVLKDILESNNMVEKYLLAALEADPKIIDKLKSKTRQIQNKAFEIDQTAESQNAENDLDDQLKQI